jgi:hypothetical protein
MPQNNYYKKQYVINNRAICSAAVLHCQGVKKGRHARFRPAVRGAAVGRPAIVRAGNAKPMQAAGGNGRQSGTQ